MLINNKNLAKDLLAVSHMKPAYIDTDGKRVYGHFVWLVLAKTYPDLHVFGANIYETINGSDFGLTGTGIVYKFSDNVFGKMLAKHFSKKMYNLQIAYEKSQQKIK